MAAVLWCGERCQEQDEGRGCLQEAQVVAGKSTQTDRGNHPSEERKLLLLVGGASNKKVMGSIPREKTNNLHLGLKNKFPT